jgi:small conductance mechanosensitive channel
MDEVLPFSQIKEALIGNFNSLVLELPRYLIAIIIIMIGVYLSNYLFRFSSRYLQKSTDDLLIANFLSKSIKYIFILIVLLFSLKIAGLGDIASGLFAAAGASAVILGFAFRDIGENFISGVILSFNRPFNVNDTVSVGDIFGKVKNLEFRYTKLKTFDGKDVYIPNSDIIKKPVFNYTEDGFLRLDFVVGISFKYDINFAEKTILEAIRKTDGVIENEEHEAFTTIDTLSTSSVDIKSYFWVHTLEYRKQAHRIKSDVISNVKQAIIDQGLSAPADIKEIKLSGSQSDMPVLVKESKN